MLRLAVAHKRQLGFNAIFGVLKMHHFSGAVITSIIDMVSSFYNIQLLEVQPWSLR